MGRVVVASKPPQADVIENILRLCGLCCAASPSTPTGDRRIHDPDGNWERDLASPGPR